MTILLNMKITKLELDGKKHCVTASAVNADGSMDPWNVAQFTVSEEQHSQLRIGQSVAIGVSSVPVPAA